MENIENTTNNVEKSDFIHETLIRKMQTLDNAYDSLNTKITYLFAIETVIIPIYLSQFKNHPIVWYFNSFPEFFKLLGLIILTLSLAFLFYTSMTRKFKDSPGIKFLFSYRTEHESYTFLQEKSIEKMKNAYKFNNKKIEKIGKYINISQSLLFIGVCIIILSIIF